MNAPQAFNIYENLSTVIILLDKQLAISHINPAAEMLLETSIEHVTGKAIAKLIGLDHKFLTGLQNTLQSHHPFTELETGMAFLNGHKIIADCTVTPLANTEQPPEHLILEITPIDRHLRIAREEQLLSNQHASQLLVRGMAHEIKNPLSGLRGAAQLLERELNKPELKEYTDIIIKEADRLQNLMDRMLGSNALPQRENVNIHEVIEHVQQIVSASLTENVSLMRDYDPSIPLLFADKDQLIQATLNLVKNALQAINDNGKITLRTRILLQHTIGHSKHSLVASIEVIDDGPGVAEDMQESIFLPMVTSKATGTGLGLPLAQALINQHNGLIQCSSEPGKTTFCMLIPIDPNL
ncbi:MAG: PAS domain-containing protein [Gammaproteobacteria bacterium]|nr:PAS domain-containing protein [Gammaproteobacteria bacterium]